MTDDAKKPLGRILLKQRAVTQPELDRALSQTDGKPLATRLTEAGAISEIDALKALSEQSGVPGIDLSQICIRLSDLTILPREIAVRHRILPVLVRDDRIFVAMAVPAETITPEGTPAGVRIEKKVIDELEFVTGKRAYPYIALAGPLMRVIHAAYEMRERGETHYVGPNCPAEILRKAGIAVKPVVEQVPPPAPPPRAEPPAQAVSRSAPREPPPSQIAPPPSSRGTPDSPREFQPAARGRGSGPLVVDDAIGRLAVADELSYSDFGAADRDLSVVEPLPEARPTPPPRAGQQTVLIVDDEADIRKLLRTVLEERGYRVLEADRGEAALHMLKESPPDCMILDAMLPEVHGFDIAKRMKGTDRLGHVPIIMISAVYRGWRFAEDMKQSYGIDTYLEKPFRMQTVIDAVENAISRKARASRPDVVSSDAEERLAAGIAAYQRGDIKAAIEALVEGTRIDPLAYRLHFHLGLLYGKQGRLYDGIGALEAAIQINGKHFPCLKNLAVLYQKAGLRNKAIEMWERALSTAPDDATRQSIKEHLLGLL